MRYVSVPNTLISNAPTYAATYKLVDSPLQTHLMQKEVKHSMSSVTHYGHIRLTFGTTKSLVSKNNTAFIYREIIARSSATTIFNWPHITSY